MEKKDIQKKKALIFKALSHPVRITILELLEDGPKCVCEITKHFDIDRTTISKHLSLLKNLDIVDDTKMGLNVYYELKMPCVIHLLKCVEKNILNKNNLKKGVDKRC